jgi:hypothetical protein
MSDDMELDDDSGPECAKCHCTIAVDDGCEWPKDGLCWVCQHERIRELEQANATLAEQDEARELLAEIMPMAMHVSCAYANDPRADDMEHCCDWGPIVDRILKVIGDAPAKAKPRCEYDKQLAKVREYALALEMENTRLKAAVAPEHPHA